MVTIVSMIFFAIFYLAMFYITGRWSLIMDEANARTKSYYPNYYKPMYGLATHVGLFWPLFFSIFCLLWVWEKVKTVIKIDGEAFWRIP